jgi:hypothetical protein
MPFLYPSTKNYKMFRIAFILMLLPATCFSQNFIGKSKDAVKKELQVQILPDESLTKTLSDNDSSIILSLYAGTSRYTDFFYGFDKSGKCKSEKIKSGCESCFNNHLDKILEQKMFEWKKINGNQYVSKYSDYLLVEIQTEKNNYSINILRTDWTRELYTMITSN